MMHLKSCDEFFGKTINPLRIYKLNYWIYVFTGFWSFESSERWKSILFKIYQSLLTLVYFFIVVTFLIDAVLVRRDLDKLSFNMSSSVLLFVTVTKISMLRIKRSSLESVLTSLGNNLRLGTVGYSKEDKEILRKRAELIVGMTKLLYGLLVVCFTLRVFADTAFDTRAYLVPMPYKEKLDRHYDFIYAQQVIVISHFLMTVISHDLLIYGIINQLLAHFEILEKNFHNIKSLYPRLNFEEYVKGYAESNEPKNILSDVLLRTNPLTKMVNVNKIPKYNLVNEPKRMETKDQTAKQLLRESINHHQTLLKEVMSFTRIYSQPLVVQACGAVLLIGIVAIKILFLSSQITPLLVQQILYAGITLINILYLCSFGSELTSKSVAAASALYDTPWYEMSAKNRKIVHFALKRLMAGPKLKGGSWIVIDRVTYLKFLKTSYNMVVVLRKIY